MSISSQIFINNYFVLKSKLDDKFQIVVSNGINAWEGSLGLQNKLKGRTSCSDDHYLAGINNALEDIRSLSYELTFEDSASGDLDIAIWVNMCIM